MRFGILGPTQVLLADGREVTVGGPRLRALLAILLLDAGRTVSTDRLIDGLYGVEPPRDATNALQSQVSRLRRELPVEFHPAGYRLAVDPDDVDAHRFGRLAAAGHRALVSGDLPRAAAVLREALDLWRGPALADVAGAPFAAAQVARLEDLRLAAVEDHAEAELGLGGHTALVAELRASVAAHPLRERLRGQLIRALYADGRQADALAEFDDARRTLADELGADPSPGLASVHLAVLRGEGSAAPHRGLPGQLTTFVGRAEELTRAAKLLGARRMVTLIGPGGVGKTRLAVEVAGRRPGDVAFVELAGVGDGSDVPQAVLSTLGLRDAGLRGPAAPTDATGRLVAALSERRLLLVLDNCEHVVSETARLAARLLGACPDLSILATSRESLGLTGEALYPVSGLAVPPADTSPVGAPEYAAVRLFADRAADVLPDFAITAANIDAILRICRTLDGLPLAIELAAARLRTLPLDVLAARLDDRFRLLSRGGAGAPPRHRTLRAVVQWSWDLLDEAEQALARRLTVFAGGATLDAAERVCGTADALTGLVDKSLVELAGGRYRMLDTIHAFCADRLAEAGETESLRRAHAAYYLDLARTADPYLRRAEQLDWLRRLDAERDNLHAALRGAAAAATDPDTALRLVGALSFYWWLRGMRGEGAALAGGVIDAVGPEAPPDLAEEYALGVLTGSLGGSPSATRAPPDRAALALAESIVERLGGPPRQPFVLYLSAMASGPPADDPEVLALLMEQKRRLLGDDAWSHALSALGLGLTWLLDGRIERAEAEFTAALDGFRALGDRWGSMVTLAARGEFAAPRGDHAVAVAPMDEALRLAEELGSIVDMADVLRIRGGARLHAGDLPGARADFRSAVDLARRAGAPEVLAAARLGLGEVARLDGDLPAARGLYETALAECPDGWFVAEGTRSEILLALARIAVAERDDETARAWYRQAVSGAVTARGLPTLAAAVEGLAKVELRQGTGGERVALLLGAASGLLPGLAPPPVGAAVRARLGDAVFEPAFARGAAMPPDEALATISGRPSAGGA